MSSRLAGAILALTAAALLALSLVTSAWWAGHPVVDGRTIELKSVHVGLHGAEGCNTGGDGACTALEMPGGFAVTGYVGLGVTGLLAVGAILLGISTLRGAEGRKTLAKVVIGLVVGAAIVAIALVVQGPKMSGSARQVSIPVGYGMILFWIGDVVAILGSVLAMRPLPKPALRPSRAAFAPGLDAPPPASQPMDVMAMFQPDPMRPAVAPPAGAGLAGPAGPLGASTGQPAPMHHAAPGLRPLYDADPNVGGAGGYVGYAQPPMPARAPTPMPLANVAEMFGNGAPPPSAPPAFAPSPPAFAPPAPAPPALAPPPPSRATSMGPAVAMPPSPPPMKVPTIPPPMPGKVPTIPPPNRARSQSVPPPPGAIAARLKASSVPPPIRAAAVPLPVAPRTLAGAVVPPPPAFQLPTRAVTDPGDLGKTIERDHDADVQVGRPATNSEIGDSTDANLPLAEAESTDVRPPLDTEEAPVVRPPTEGDDAETNAIEKQTIDDTGVQDKVEPVAAAAPPAVIAPPAPPASPASPAPIEPAPIEAAPVEAAPKIPISTAPDSLPPPTEKQAATSGPSPACPQCEAPMAWVEEHLRFYCKSCRMYF